MADARCPEPKPIFIFALGVAGFIGEYIAGFISKLLVGSLSPFVTEFIWAAIFGGGMGMVTAVSLALSKRLWLSAGMATYIGGMVPYLGLLLIDYRTSGLQIDLRESFLLGSPVALAMALAHGLFLRANRLLRIAGGPAYVVLGALGRHHLTTGPPGAFWMRFDSELNIVLGGAVFGLMQYIAMLAALAVDRKMRSRLDPPPASPSPDPGP